MNVGFVGLGTMGLPMVVNLAKNDHKVFVFDAQENNISLAEKSKNVHGCSNPREVAEKAEVVFTCLPNDDIVREVYLGKEGLISGSRQGLITCDASTVSASTTKEISKKLETKGVTHMDTPMLGSQPQAISGEIFFIVGGNPKALPTISPLLDAMGKMHLHAGENGSANIIKLIHNSLAAVTSVAVSESLAACSMAGVDPKILYQVVCNGGGMAYSNYFERRVARMLDGEFSPTFSLELMLKDITLGRALADELGVATPMMEEARSTYQRAKDAGWGNEDFSAVSKVAEKRLGRKIFP